MTRLFTADYSTAGFSQWRFVSNKAYNGAAASYLPSYPAQIAALDGDCGHGGRFEVRTGDVPIFGGGERSEVSASDDGLAATGTTRWYAFSLKFDPTFPTNHATLGFGIVHQFHDHPSGLSSPLISWGWQASTDPQFRSGYWYLMWQPQSSPGVYLGNVPLLELPFNLGQWWDIKMQIHWATDSTGSMKVWLNGAPQTFIPGAWGSGSTFTGMTVLPGGGVDGVSVQQGYYRANGIAPTGIVYHTGFRMADSEASL